MSPSSEAGGRSSLKVGEVSYIGSAGIGELVATYTAARNRGCELKLLNLTKKVQEPPDYHPRDDGL
jgi:anti-anti-sigma regulatory factor